ncbi:MAG: hypothetical protein JWR24_2951 [Actinoallomurus sp.]|nr:hypothetical protein [Actinoallomurus sp.]
MAGEAEHHRGAHAGHGRYAGHPSADDGSHDGHGGRHGPAPVPRRSGGRAPLRLGSVPPVAYFAAAGVVMLVAVIVAAALVVLGDGGHKAAAPTAPPVAAGGPVPSAYSQAPSTPVFEPIGKRSADARPLTADEVFGTKTIVDADSKASLKLAASKIDAQCTAAVWGGGLAGQLQRAGCTQATRGVYTDKHFAAMVTIFNLADSSSADRLVAAADPKSGNGFALPLTTARPFGQAFSIARGLAMGHYAVITWVQRADGTGDEKDTGLLSLLVTAGRPGAVLLRAAGNGQAG